MSTALLIAYPNAEVKWNQSLRRYYKVANTKQWFLPGGAYAHANGYDIDHIAQELSNYFSAWISVVGESWIT